MTITITKTFKLSFALCMFFISIMSTNVVAHGQEKNITDALAQELLAQLLLTELDNIDAANQSATDSSRECRNSQIMSYSPLHNSHESQLPEFVFYTNSDIYIPSLELTINEKSYPVQYTEMPDGSFKVRAVNTDSITGNVYVAMGAQSQTVGACNSLLYTSFTVQEKQTISTVNQNNTSSISGNTAANNSDTTAETKTIVAVGDTTTSQNENNTQIIVNVATTTTTNVDGGEENNTKGFFAWVSGLFTNNEKAKIENKTDLVAESEILVNATSSTTSEDNTALITSGVAAAGAVALQKANIGSALEATKNCSTVGANWSWYVYLAIIWLWLVAVWVAISYYAEPAFGTAQYAQRLTIIAIASAVGGLLLWYVTNPCFTHPWLPATFIALAILLHWLYSEDAHTI